MESKQETNLTFDPKSYYKQPTMTFAHKNDDDFDDELIDDEMEIEDFTPSTATEEATMKYRQIAGITT